MNPLAEFAIWIVAAIVVGAGILVGVLEAGRYLERRHHGRD